VLRHSTTKHSS